MRDLSIYIHIPFCKRRCYYCDFVTFSDKNEKIDKYIEYLLKEIDMYGDNGDKYIINTIFIGGGTPSYIDEKYIEMIMERLYGNFNIRKDAEITIEANPGTLSREKLESYKKAGINRISMGLQSLNDDILSKIGRIHNSEEFFENYKIVREVGFENVNVDLMFDLPDQTTEILLDTVRRVIDLNPEHISLYSLIFEEGTKLTRDYEQGKLNLADEDEERDMYHRAIELLKNDGYEHYEISNFAKKDKYSEHNIRYWDIVPYLGLGLASHSLYEGDRFYNFKTFEEYFESIDRGECPIEGREGLKIEDEILEYIIMRLRLIKGIDKNVFRERFGKDIGDIYREAVEKNIRNGLLEEKMGYLCFTERGLDISNQVYLDFMP